MSQQPPDKQVKCYVASCCHKVSDNLDLAKIPHAGISRRIVKKKHFWHCAY